MSEEIRWFTMPVAGGSRRLVAVVLRDGVALPASESKSLIESTPAEEALSSAGTLADALDEGVIEISARLLETLGGGIYFATVDELATLLEEALEVEDEHKRSVFVDYILQYASPETMRHMEQDLYYLYLEAHGFPVSKAHRVGGALEFLSVTRADGTVEYF